MIRGIITGVAVCVIIALTTGLNALSAERAGLPELLKALKVTGYPSLMHPPDFSSLTADGQTLSLNSLRGKVLLFNFWASWCLECRPEMPMFERLHREFSAQGLAVVGINAREGTSTIRAYAKN